MIKRALLSLVLLAGCLTAYNTYDYYYGDWAAHAMPPADLQPWTEPLSAQAKEILRQPFTYLAEGGQSYVFVSADQRYVLKLFKFHRLVAPWYTAYIPNIPPFQNTRAAIIEKRRLRLETLLTGHLLAFHHLPHETGMIAIQLAPSHEELPLIAIEPSGRPRTLDLGRLAFALQERGETAADHFAAIDDLETLKSRIDALLNLHLAEYAKGIHDADHGLMHNAGFINGRAVRLDVGSLTLQPASYSQDLTKAAAKITAWARRERPTQAEALTAHIEAQLKNLFVFIQS